MEESHGPRESSLLQLRQDQQHRLHGQHDGRLQFTYYEDINTIMGLTVRPANVPYCRAPFFGGRKKLSRQPLWPKRYIIYINILYAYVSSDHIMCSA